MALEVLTFQIDDHRLGVPARDVVEVVRAVKLSPATQAPATVEGLLNLRGKVVPVVDLRRALGLSRRPIRQSDHLIVVRTAGRVITLRADRALALLQLEDSNIEPADGMLATSLVNVVGRIDDGFVHILDVEGLLSSDDASLATDSVQSGPVEPAP